MSTEEDQWTTVNHRKERPGKEDREFDAPIHISGNVAPDHQQWNDIIIRKKTTAKDRKKAIQTQTQSQTVITIPRKAANNSVMRKLDQDTDVHVVAKVSQVTRQALMNARIAKGLSQKDLALLLSVKTSVIADWEAGRAQVDGAFLSRLNRVLDTKLPR